MGRVGSASLLMWTVIAFIATSIVCELSRYVATSVMLYPVPECDPEQYQWGSRPISGGNRGSGNPQEYLAVTFLVRQPRFLLLPICNWFIAYWAFHPYTFFLIIFPFKIFVTIITIQIVKCFLWNIKQIFF